MNKNVKNMKGLSKTQTIKMSFDDDSKIIELEFTINNIDYFAKIHVDISYNRWYYRETYSNPMEDEVELVSKEITIIKIVKFINGDEVKLKSKENKKIENHIIENIEIC
jgi:hypothetical protein